jgi:tetraacyldisaccharide-1-P 4'-kinase
MNFSVNGNLFITTEKDFVKIKYFDKFTVNFKLLFLKLKYNIESTELIDEKIL